MGAIESTTRWTPYGPSASSRRSKQNSDDGIGMSSPSNSTSNLSPTGYGSDMEDNNNSDNSNTINNGISGANATVAMRMMFMHENNNINNNNNNISHKNTSTANNSSPPPLYEACLIGNWQQVLEICREGHNLPGAATSETSHLRGTAESSTVETSTAHEATATTISAGTEPTVCSEASTTDNTPPSSPNNYSSWPLLLQVTFTDHRLNTPLHLACRRQPPPNVIRALLDLLPLGGVLAQTADGLTPLHFACYCGAGTDVVRLLVERMKRDTEDAATATTAMNATIDALEDRSEDHDQLNDVNETSRREEELGNERIRDSDDAPSPITTSPPNPWALAMMRILPHHYQQQHHHHRKLNHYPPLQQTQQQPYPHQQSPQSHPPPQLPPTRLLDRRLRTPLHCTCTGFRTSNRPLILRILLSIDPASATLADERGRSPLTLLFDDYAEEIMEALDEDVSREMVKRRVAKGGELYECWRMLRVLLEAAYLGSVSNELEEEDDSQEEGERVGGDGNVASLMVVPQDRDGVTYSTAALLPSTFSQHPASSSDTHHHHHPKEINVLDVYERHKFSMVHAVAGVWECPAPLAKLVLKCLCGSGDINNDGRNNIDTRDYLDAGINIRHNNINFIPTIHTSTDITAVHSCNSTGARAFTEDDHYGTACSNDWNSNISYSATTALTQDGSIIAEKKLSNKRCSPSHRRIQSYHEREDAIHQPDEESMRLPLHIALCARPQDWSGARIKYWLSSSEASSIRRMGMGMVKINNINSSTRRPSTASLNSTLGGISVCSSRAGSGGNVGGGGRVYNPRFGRIPSSDEVTVFSTFQQHNSFGSSHGMHLPHPPSSSPVPLSSSILMAEEDSFLQHSMVRDILALYPPAASVLDPRTGKLPIVLAIEYGKSWEMAVGPLLEAHPTPFAGEGDGGLALPDDSEESICHRKALQGALLLALTGPEASVKEEAIRTAGKLANWGGVWGMADGLDRMVTEWIDWTVQFKNRNSSSKGGNSEASTDVTSPEGIIVGPGAISNEFVDKVKIQAALLRGVAEVVSFSRVGAVSDRVARLCLDTGREFLFSKDGYVREAAARVIGAALDAAGDSDDATTVIQEVVLNVCNEEASVGSTSPIGRGREDDAIVKHGKLLACTSILSIKHGSIIMSNKEISDAIVSLVRRRIKDKNTVLRAAAYRALGPVLGKSPSPEDPKMAMITTSTILKELRSDILKGTSATEQVEVHLALARGLISATKIHPSIFLCKVGMPIMDAALMLAMSSSTARPQVQKAFQGFLWVALQIRRDDDLFGNVTGDNCDSSNSNHMSEGLEKYIELAEGDNGRIMMTFVTRTLAKMEKVDEEFLVT